MKAMPIAAALLALTAGCGGHSAKTRLTIQLGSGAYDLSCDPARGTMGDPASVCHALAHEPELLVGGPSIDHSCPAPNRPSTTVGVRGTYRGHPVEAVFTDTGCSWTPGQDGALAEWKGLLAASRPGRPVAGEPTSSVRVDGKKAEALRQELRHLVKQREDAGNTNLDAGALKIIRDQAQLSVVAGGPLIRRVTASRVLGRPRFLVVTRYAYRDYAGREHPAKDGIGWELIDRRTLETTDWGLGEVPTMRRLGRPVTLDF